MSDLKWELTGLHACWRSGDLMFTEGFALRYCWSFKADCCRARQSFSIKNRPAWLIGSNPQKKVSLNHAVAEKTMHQQSETVQDCFRKEAKTWPVGRPRAESWTQISHILGDHFSFQLFQENLFPIEIVLLCINEYRAGLATKLSPVTTWGFGAERSTGAVLAEACIVRATECETLELGGASSYPWQCSPKCLGPGQK